MPALGWAARELLHMHIHIHMVSQDMGRNVDGHLPPVNTGEGRTETTRRRETSNARDEPEAAQGEGQGHHAQ